MSMLMLYLSMLEGDDDRQFFLHLHRAYERKLYQVAHSILHAQPLAEEAVQSSWVKVIQNFEKIKSISWDKTEGYLVSIVKNTSLTMLKKERHTDPFPDDWAAPTVSPPPTDEFGRLVALVRGMPERYRALLELKFVLEWSNQEIAQKTGLSESTVATRIARGRALLISKLREEEYSYE